MVIGCDFDLVGIEKVSSLDYLAAVFRCYEERTVFAPIEPGTPPPGPRGWARTITPDKGGGWFSASLPPILEDTPAQISFSSGTTGAPKAIVLSHRALADVVERLGAAMAIDGRIREYLGVPATYSFGLGRARAVAAAGGALFVPDNGFDPRQFAAMLEAGQVNAVSLVPTLLRVLLANPELVPAAARGRLEWLEIGSQPFSAAEKVAVRELFPEARIVQHYGLTEASRSTFLDIGGATGPGELDSVGRPTGAVEVKIDEGGRICIRGPHVALGILGADGIAPLTDPDGWLRTNDLGRMGADGYLQFLGRADDLLNVCGIKVPAALFEEKLASRLGPDAGGVAVAGAADPLRGELVLVAHEPGVDPVALREASRSVAADFALGAADLVVAGVAALPRTDTGKIQRRRLAEIYEAQSRAAPAPVPGPATAPSPAAAAAEGFAPLEAQIARIWQDALGVDAISRHESFFTLGGDSLSAISVALTAEQNGMSPDLIRQMLEGHTIAEIAAMSSEGADPVRPRRSALARTGETINALRGALVLLVIAAHWGPFAFEKIGSVGATLYGWLLPVFAMGTPGFAMVFGIGISFFYAPILEASPRRLKSKVRTNALILAGGILVGAALSATRIAVTPSLTFGPIWPERLLYTVLLPYLLLMISVPWLLRIVRLTPRVILNCLTLSLVSLSVLIACKLWLEDAPTTGFANLGRLLLFSAYSYPQMLVCAALGMAFGEWLRKNPERLDDPGIFAQLGFVLLMAGTIFALFTGGFWANLREPHLFIVYSGVIVASIPVLAALARFERTKPLVQVLAIIGLLAFPAFVAHGAVLSVKNIIVTLGAPDLLGMAFVLGAFFAAAWLAIRHLWRLYYGAPTAQA